MKIKNLETYIKENIKMEENNDYYNESFCNLTFDYLGCMGEFSGEDKNYLKSKGYSYIDFIEED